MRRMGLNRQGTIFKMFMIYERIQLYVESTLRKVLGEAQTQEIAVRRKKVRRFNSTEKDYVWIVETQEWNAEYNVYVHNLMLIARRRMYFGMTYRDEHTWSLDWLGGGNIDRHQIMSFSRMRPEKR